MHLLAYLMLLQVVQSDVVLGGQEAVNKMHKIAKKRPLLTINKTSNRFGSGRNVTTGYNGDGYRHSFVLTSLLSPYRYDAFFS